MSQGKGKLQKKYGNRGMDKSHMRRWLGKCESMWYKKG